MDVLVTVLIFLIFLIMLAVIVFVAPDSWGDGNDPYGGGVSGG